MKTFLEYVVEDILEKCGSDLSRTMVVFPNKRASLFFNNHLARIAQRPIWSPAYTTISELFRSHSALKVADDLTLVNQLYQCFKEVTGSDESIDHFFGWGQMMIADFDDIDKNMADAKKIFAHIHALHELDDMSYLTDDQREAIKRFYCNFTSESLTELQRKFLELWKRFYDIYDSFNKKIRERGFVYEGALYRSVVESKNLSFDYERYIFVGFNLIQKVEQKLFELLKSEGKAMFYWDFDSYYMPTAENPFAEAGYYINMYKDKFPNELRDVAEDVFNNFEGKKEIEFVAATTENIQARYVASWLNAVKNDANLGQKPDTAVVLCNERLLQTVVNSIPDDIQNINVTLGYPLHSSPYSSTIFDHLKGVKTTAEYLSKAKRYVEDETLRLKEEQTIQQEAFRKTTIATSDTTDEYSPDPLPAECLFRLYTILQRFEGLIAEENLQIKVETLDRLFRQMIRTTTVPFSGEPAIGLQVMGVLETRNLDFRNLLVLSCNEGNIPKGVNDTSFIPYSIRKAYGLTTIDHKVAVYAYYFYRLLQRAEKITLVYNAATDDTGKKEMSRFMLQMMVESSHKIAMKTLRGGDMLEDKGGEDAPSPDAESNETDASDEAETSATVDVKLGIEKTEKVMERLRDRFTVGGKHHRSAKKKDSEEEDTPLLTPTAINLYMRCPVQFYFRYVLGYKEETDNEAGIDGRVFGTLFHDAAEYLYTPLVKNGGVVDKKTLDYLISNPAKVAEAVKVAFDKNKDVDFEDSGLSLLVRDVITTYLHNLLRNDLKLVPFTIIGLECPVMDEYAIEPLGATTTIGGRIDRLDKVEQDGITRIRVVDYKTGAGKVEALKGVGEMFEVKSLSKHNDYYLQTFLYGKILSSGHKFNPKAMLPVSPALFYIQRAASDDYDPTLKFDKEKIVSMAQYMPQFDEGLKRLVDEIFSADKPFCHTDNEKICEYCPYRQLCDK